MGYLINQWRAGFSGTYGGAYNLRVELEFIGNEPNNNRSLVSFSAWVEQVANNRYSVYNVSSDGDTNKNGQVDYRGGGINLNGQGQRKYLAQNEAFWVGHNGNGDARIYVDAYWKMKLESYGYGSARAGGDTDLPHINRYANITNLSLSEVTDEAFTINVSVDALCNFLQISYEDGVGWRDIYGADFYNYSYRRSALQSNTQYNIRARVRRADSGLWSESGVVSTVTGQQGNYVDSSGL